MMTYKWFVRKQARHFRGVTFPNQVPPSSRPPTLNSKPGRFFHLTLTLNPKAGSDARTRRRSILFIGIKAAGLQPIHRRRVFDGELPRQERAQRVPARLPLRRLVPRRRQASAALQAYLSQASQRLTCVCAAAPSMGGGSPASAPGPLAPATGTL